MKATTLANLSKKALATMSLFYTLKGAEVKANPIDSSDVAARLIKYEVRWGFEDRFRQAVSDYVFYSLSLESNILSEAYYEQDKTSVLWIIERWTNKKALAKTSSSAQFKAIEALSKSALLHPPTTFYVKDLEPLSKAQWRREANVDDKPLTIMLFVDSESGTEKTFENVYHRAMPAFRSEPGVINYQLSRLEADSTRFVTYEKFRSEAAFEYHLNFPAIEPVLSYLKTSIKRQPFQHGLHTLLQFAPHVSK